MVNAQELINKQKEREQIKTLTYDKIYSFIEKKIILSSEGNSYYTWYQIPEFFIGLPLYSIDECQIYIRNKFSLLMLIPILYAILNSCNYVV